MLGLANGIIRKDSYLVLFIPKYITYYEQLEWLLTKYYLWHSTRESHKNTKYGKDLAYIVKFT